MSIAILVVGLLMTILGAWRTASAVIIDKKTADALAGTYWGSNLALKQALLDQSRAASCGLKLIVFGSALQIVGTVLQAIIAQRR